MAALLRHKGENILHAWNQVTGALSPETETSTSKIQCIEIFFSLEVNSTL